MSNAPRRQKAEKGKYEGKKFLDYEEAADYLGVKRSTLYNYLTTLRIDTHKFKLDKKRYVAIEDVKHIERVIEEPWLAGPDEKSVA